MGPNEFMMRYYKFSPQKYFSDLKRFIVLNLMEIQNILGTLIRADFERIYRQTPYHDFQLATFEEFLFEIKWEIEKANRRKKNGYSKIKLGKDVLI